MNNRWLWLLLGVIAFFIVLFTGAAAGAGLTYLALRARPVEAASSLVLQESIDLDTKDYEAGVVVIHIEPDSPADKAGIQRGDIILSVDEKQVNTMLDLMREIEGKSAGDEILIKVQHCESTKEVSVELEEQNGHVFLGLHMSRLPLLGMMPLERGAFVLPAEIPAFYIAEIISGGPADDAGLEKGDMIVSIDGKQFQAGEDLAEIVQSYQPGDEIILDIAKSKVDQAEQVSITLGEHPDDPSLPYLGITYKPIPGFQGEDLREQLIPKFEAPDFQGKALPLPDMLPGYMPKWHQFPALPEGVEQAVVISSVSEEGPADQAGLEAGDLIVLVNGDNTPDPETFVDMIHSYDEGDEITLTLYRSGEEEAIEVDVVLGENPDVEGQAYLGVTISSFLRIESSSPFHDFGVPFHFDFHFPWSEGEVPELQVEPDMGDEA